MNAHTHDNDGESGTVYVLHFDPPYRHAGHYIGWAEDADARIAQHVARWEAGPSPCGRAYLTLPRGIYGRIDDQFTVRGENIYPSAIDEVVSGLGGYGGEHRVVVSREDSMDTLAVQLECSRELEQQPEAEAAFCRQAADPRRATLGVRAHVAPNTFECTEFKARWVIDQRDLFRHLLDSK